jgi:hypothetical protein
MLGIHPHRLGIVIDCSIIPANAAFWELVISVARMYDVMFGVIVMVPVALLSPMLWLFWIVIAYDGHGFGSQLLF